MSRPVKEVRFAVVMYGGVSLAIYIHGVARELLSLVRATAPKRRGSPKPLVRQPTGAESAYRKLAHLLDWSGGAPRMAIDGWKIRDGRLQPPPKRGFDPGARFIVDILSGTSAGGINAIFLAKALANVQPLDDLSRLWRSEGDISVLLNDKESAAGAGGMLKGLPRQVPPASLLDSRRMYVQLLDALRGMERSRPSSENRDSPLVDELNLYITATDLRGQPVILRLADGTSEERQHRQVFHFVYASEHAAGGRRANQFVRQNDPMLAFAARATSSFPVAFEPMALEDVEEVLRRTPLKRFYEYKPESWRRFFRGSVAGYRSRPFGDGGYLDNKPFSYATETLARQRTDPLVDRKLIYIEPAPETVHEPDPAAPRPDALDNAVAAAVSLPRYETIRQDLEAILDRNRALRRLRRILFVASKRTARDRALFLGRKRAWATQAWKSKGLREMEEEYGISYVLYHQLRVDLLVDELAALIARVGGFAGGDAEQAIRELVKAWKRPRFSPEPGEGRAKHSENLLLYDFDLSWRLRRLNSLRQWIDRLYRLDKDALEIIASALEVQEAELEILDEDATEYALQLEAELREAREASDADRIERVESQLRSLEEWRESSRDETRREGGRLASLRAVLDRLAAAPAEGDAADLEDSAAAATHRRFRRALLEAISPAVNHEFIELRAFGRRLRAGFRGREDQQRRYREAASKLRRRWSRRRRRGQLPGDLARLLELPQESADPAARLRHRLAEEMLADPDSKLAPLLVELIDALRASLKRRMGRSTRLMRRVLGLPARLDGKPPQWVTEARQRLAELGDEGKLARAVCAAFYKGYEYYDMVSLPLLFNTDLEEADEVEIFRISPRDATSLVDERETGPSKLAGTALGNFGAFLKQEWRDNDMLWGRLDAAERLIQALLPDALVAGDPRKARFRNLLVAEAQEGILRQVLPDADRSAASRLLSEVLYEIAAQRGRAEQAERDWADRPWWRRALGLPGRLWRWLRGEATQPQQVRARLQRLLHQRELRIDEIENALRLGTAPDELRELFRRSRPPRRPLPPEETLRAAGRAARVFGAMLEGITQQRQGQRRAAAWVSRVAQVLWGVVIVSVPGSFWRLISHHLFKLIFTLLVLLLVAGSLLSQEQWVKTALAAILAGGAIYLVTLLLERFMLGSLGLDQLGSRLGRAADALHLPHGVRRFAGQLLRALLALLVAGALVAGAYTLWEKYGEIGPWLLRLLVGPAPGAEA